MVECIGSIEDLLLFVRNNRLENDDEHIHLKEWFRGHSDNSYKLHPGIYRKPFESENNIILRENYFRQDFMIQSAIIAKTDNDAERYFLQQHYGMPTRLLDWTNNPLVGLFFALEGNEDRDGELFMLNAYKFSINNFKGNFGIATVNNRLLIDALAPCFSWKGFDSYGADYPKFIIPVRPKHNDPRMVLQNSFFTFHALGKELLTVSDNPTLVSAIIPGSSKAKLKKDLSNLGINYYSVFGDLVNLSKKIKFDYNF